MVLSPIRNDGRSMRLKKELGGFAVDFRLTLSPQLKLARVRPRSWMRFEPIGGNSPHKSRFEIDWQNPVTGEAVRIRITHAREYLTSGSDHIEVESIKPKKAPLPITETGYRSHFMPATELINAGGPVTFITSWIAREASSKVWTKAATVKAQGDLFSWANAKSEVGAKRKAKPSKPVAQPRKKPRRDRAPE